MRLFFESVFVPIDKWYLTLKNGGKKSFSYESKTIKIVYPNKENELWCPIMKRMEITM